MIQESRQIGEIAADATKAACGAYPAVPADVVGHALILAGARMLAGANGSSDPLGEIVALAAQIVERRGPQ